MPSPHFGNAPTIVGCLEPVRTDEQFLAFKEMGGSRTVEDAREDMHNLTGRQLGDLFLVKSGVWAVIGWARATDAGGRGVDVSHGFGEGEMATKLENFAAAKHESKRLFAVTWDDEQGKPQLDRVRLEAKLRAFAGLPLPSPKSPGVVPSGLPLPAPKNAEAVALAKDGRGGP